MTIKEFSRLCGCNPQTLRYYDQRNLLKPAHVDPYSGYRFYREEQALDFVKIKHLQEAGFTIGEIKSLLSRDSDEIVKAFDEKILEQERRLENTRRIRQSYQAERNKMENQIQAARNAFVQTIQDYSAEEEFGIDKAHAQRIASRVMDYFDHMASKAGNFEFKEDSDDSEVLEEPEYDFLNDPAYEVLLERHGWNRAKDILEEITHLPEGNEFALYFQTSKEQANIAFALTAMGLLLERNPSTRRSYGCNVTRSQDGSNHFWLLRPKAET